MASNIVVSSPSPCAFRASVNSSESSAVTAFELPAAVPIPVAKVELKEELPYEH